MWNAVLGVATAALMGLGYALQRASRPATAPSVAAAATAGAVPGLHEDVESPVQQFVGPAKLPQAAEVADHNKNFAIDSSRPLKVLCPKQRAT